MSGNSENSFQRKYETVAKTLVRILNVVETNTNGWKLDMRGRLYAMFAALMSARDLRIRNVTDISVLVITDMAFDINGLVNILDEVSNENEDKMRIWSDVWSLYEEFDELLHYNDYDSEQFFNDRNDEVDRFKLMDSEER